MPNNIDHIDWVTIAAVFAVLGGLIVFIKKSAGVLTVKDDLDSHVNLTAPMVRDWPFLKKRVRIVEKQVESGERERNGFREEVLEKINDVHVEIGELKNLIITTLANGNGR